jgi:hypothetical protein
MKGYSKMLARFGKSWMLGALLVVGCFAWLGETATADPPRGRIQNRGMIVPRNGFVPGNVGRGFVPNNQFRYRYGYGYTYNPYWGAYPGNPWVPYYGVPYYGYYPRPGSGIGVGGWPRGPSFGGGGFPSGPSYGGGAGNFRGGR